EAVAVEPQGKAGARLRESRAGEHERAGEQQEKTEAFSDHNRQTHSSGLLISDFPLQGASERMSEMRRRQHNDTGAHKRVRIAPTGSRRPVERDPAAVL